MPARFETIVDSALEERICRLSASGLSAPKIHEVLSDEMDFPPHERTIRRVVKRNEASIAARMVRDLEVNPPPIPAPLQKVRQRQAASRKRVASAGVQYDEVLHSSGALPMLSAIPKDPNTCRHASV